MSNKDEVVYRMENTIQPISDDYSTDGHLDDFARVDHQHPLSPSLQAKISGGGSGRNLLHNGEMMVSQRVAPSTFVAVPVGGGTYTDRWIYVPPNVANTAIYPNYISQNFDFGAMMIIDAGAPAKTVYAVNEYSYIRQGIEGRNLQHLQWGTVNAKPLCYSFYALTNTPGTYIVEFELAGSNSISRAVTLTGVLTKYSVTIPGHTTVAIPNNSNGAVWVNIWLGASTTYAGGTSLNTAWTNGATNTRAFGQVNFFSVASRQFWLTGCQLEIGTSPSAFEHISYADTLFQCQRYFRIPQAFDFFGTQENTTNAMMMTYFHPSMRAAPTVAQLPGTLVIELPFIAFLNLTGLGSTASSLNAARVNVTFAAAGALGYPAHNQNAWLTLSAEI